MVVTCLPTPIAIRDIFNRNNIGGEYAELSPTPFNRNKKMPYKEKPSTRYRRVRRAGTAVRTATNAFGSWDHKLRKHGDTMLTRHREESKDKKSIPKWKKISKDHKEARNIAAARYKKLRKSPRAKAAIRKAIKKSIKRSQKAKFDNFRY